jgi:hypothetical protein
VTRVTKAIVASQASYTIGTGGNIARARPTGITKAAVLLTAASPDLEIPIAVWSQEQWEAVSQKDLTGAQPTAIYYNPTYPLGTIHPWPIGTDTTISLVLYLEEPVTTLATLDTALAFPPGYERMLRYRLALDMSAEYHREPSPLVVQIAQESMAAIKRVNLRPALLRCDAGVLAGTGRGSDIYSGN